MKTIKEMIEVMTAYDNGAEVEYKGLEPCDWTILKTPCWDWVRFSYRIKEQKKTVTIEKWLVFNDIRYDEVITSNIDDLMNTCTGWNKVKLLGTYEVKL